MEVPEARRAREKYIMLFHKIMERHLEFSVAAKNGALHVRVF